MGLTMQAMRAREGTRGTRATDEMTGARASAAGVPPLLTRVGDGPLLTPTGRWWEDRAVFNPGAAEDADGVIHLLYRAQGRDMISRIGYARTRDGVTIEERVADPVLEPGHNEFERLGLEDPRIVRMRDGFYVLYIAASQYEATDVHAGQAVPWRLPGRPPEEPPWRVRVALALTKDFRTFTRLGVVLPELDDKDAVLFPEKIGGEFVILHRLPPDVWIATSADLKDWTEHQVVLRTRPALWDESRVGAGPPPIRTTEGWLLCYHGADHHNVYRAGFALLALDDPSRVLGRSDEPVLEPVTSWEVRGQVPRVVFPTGMVQRGDELLVYYGAADSVVGVARGSVQAILGSLR